MQHLIIVVIAVILVAAVAMLVVGTIALLAAAVTMPSIAAMRAARFVGLTDPAWYVVLHAALGAAVGFWAHRVPPDRVRVLLISIVAAIILALVASAVLPFDPR